MEQPTDAANAFKRLDLPTIKQQFAHLFDHKRLSAVAFEIRTVLWLMNLIDGPSMRLTRSNSTASSSPTVATASTEAASTEAATSEAAVLEAAASLEASTDKTPQPPAKRPKTRN